PAAPSRAPRPAGGSDQYYYADACRQTDPGADDARPGQKVPAMTYAIIPARGFSGAKQRLATFLQPHERRLLARAMLTDTLTACSQATALEGVGVVTCDGDVAEVAEAFGAEVLWGPEAQGHSQAGA